jgi:3-oxoadipate enol-lactonase
MPWIEANGASLRYELSGAGKETLVLVHEAGGCLESYEDALPGLEKEFRVLRYDQRGFGFSEKARELTFEGVAADLAALLDALNKAKPPATKGIFLRKVSVSSTMGLGVKVDPASFAAQPQ